MRRWLCLLWEWSLEYDWLYSREYLSLIDLHRPRLVEQWWGHTSRFVVFETVFYRYIDMLQCDRGIVGIYQMTREEIRYPMIFYRSILLHVWLRRDFSDRYHPIFVPLLPDQAFHEYHWITRYLRSKSTTRPRWR